MSVKRPQVRRPGMTSFPYLTVDDLRHERFRLLGARPIWLIGGLCGDLGGRKSLHMRNNNQRATSQRPRNMSRPVKHSRKQGAYQLNQSMELNQSMTAGA